MEGLYRLPTLVRSRPIPGPMRRFGPDALLVRSWLPPKKRQKSKKVEDQPKPEVSPQEAESLEAQDVRTAEEVSQSKATQIPKTVPDTFWSGFDYNSPWVEAPFQAPQPNAVHEAGKAEEVQIARPTGFVTREAINAAQSKYKKSKVIRGAKTATGLSAKSKRGIKISSVYTFAKRKQPKTASAKTTPKPPPPPFKLDAESFTRLVREVLKKFDPAHVFHAQQVMKAHLSDNKDESGALVIEAVKLIELEVGNATRESKRIDRKLLHRVAMKFFGELIKKAWDQLEMAIPIEDSSVKGRLRRMQTANRSSHAVYEFRLHVESETYYLVEIEKRRISIHTAMSYQRFKRWLGGRKCCSAVHDDE